MNNLRLSRRLFKSPASHDAFENANQHIHLLLVKGLDSLLKRSKKDSVLPPSEQLRELLFDLFHEENLQKNLSPLEKEFFDYMTDNLSEISNSFSLESPRE